MENGNRVLGMGQLVKPGNGTASGAWERDKDNTQ